MGNQMEIGSYSPTNIEINNLFESFDIDANDNIKKKDLLTFINNCGITTHDSRLSLFFISIKKMDTDISRSQFKELIQTNHQLFNKIFKGDLIIPKWRKFSKEIEDIFNEIKNTPGGNVATYIPQLAKTDENLVGLSITTIDGQQLSLGDYKHSFCIQSCSKPISYCIAVEEHGEKKVHNHVGREPSGKNFNELCLGENKLPHNPLINSGSIMSVSLIKYKEKSSNRFDHIIDYWRRLAGNSKVNFNNSVYLSERDSADRNFCLGYMMQENNSFSTGKDETLGREWNPEDLRKNLELYFQCCSIEVNTQQASVIAASLANGGVCPVTNEKILDSENVKNVLSLMSSCGMYDYSGEWAYTIGIPAKSGVSGIIMGVIPNVMGIAIFAPKLDNLGNSVKGIEFFKKLVENYNFHLYDNILNERKKNVLKSTIHNEDINTYLLLLACYNGDLEGIQRLISQKVDLNSTDYDKRSALHIAASEGHEKIVKFLVDKGCRKDLKDRWGNT